MPSRRTRRSSRRIIAELLTEFIPALYNRDELEFFKTHLGETPRVAMSGGLPPRVNPRAVEEVLGSVAEYRDLQAADRHNLWVGETRMIETIDAYLSWQDETRAMREQLGIANPSMYAWSPQGEGVRSGVGADTHIVRTALKPGGKRIKLTLRLDRPARVAGVDKPFVPSFMAGAESEAPPRALLDDEEGHLECPICAHVVNYEVGQAASRNRARAVMARHLKASRVDRSKHQTLYSVLFRGTRTEAVPELASAGG